MFFVAKYVFMPGKSRLQDISSATKHIITSSQNPLKLGEKAHKEITNMSLRGNLARRRFLHVRRAISYNHTNASTTRSSLRSITPGTHHIS